MRNKVKSIVREGMIEGIMDIYEKNPMKDTPFEALAIKNILVILNKNYKKKLGEQRHKLGMSEQEMNDLIDEVTTELHKKFLN